MAQSSSDVEAAEVEVGEALVQRAQVVLLRCRAARGRGRCAVPGAGGVLAGGASIAASAASESLKPSAPKNLIPLSRYGLCEARDHGREVEPVAAEQQRRGGRRQHAAEQHVAAGGGDARRPGRPRASRPTRACRG